MPDISTTPIWAWPAGSFAIFIGIKYLLPWIQQSMSAQSTQWRTENKFTAQMVAERDKALEEKKVAEDKADSYFTALSEMKTEVRLLTLQLQIANEKIEALTSTVNDLRGVRDA